MNLKKIIAGTAGMSLLFIRALMLQAEGETVRIHVTALKASNQGSDFNLENDAYRDQLLTLFSYSSYEQLDSFLVEARKSERQSLVLPGGYEMLLTLQGEEKERVLIQALIRREGKQYVDTVLSILKPGVVFLGGPPLEGQGVLLLVVESRGNGTAK